MSKVIGTMITQLREHRIGVGASGAGIELFFQEFPYGPPECESIKPAVLSLFAAREIAVWLVQAADEVERMRAERANFAKPEPTHGAGHGLVEAQCHGGKGGASGNDHASRGDGYDSSSIESIDLSGNPHFDRGG